ncbi:hypothetical protein BH09BAC1_BH09BAC1_07180 [soil metagenome]
MLGSYGADDSFMFFLQMLGPDGAFLQLYQFSWIQDLL